LYTKDKQVIKRENIKSKFKHDQKKLEENKDIIKRVKKEDHFKIKEWMCGYNGQISGESGYGGIYDTYSYVNDRYGSGWTANWQRYLNVTPRLQNDLESGANNCTLSSITMVFDYHRSRGIWNTFKH